MTITLNDELIERLFSGEMDGRDLARALGVSLEELARWASRPHAAKLLRGLIRLADVRTQMLICRYRANAAAQLIDMATSGDPSELARKACVDLLRTEMKITDPDDGADEDDAPAPPSEEAIREALEQLGGE